MQLHKLIVHKGSETSAPAEHDSKNKGFHQVPVFFFQISLETDINSRQLQNKVVSKTINSRRVNNSQKQYTQYDKPL